METVEKPLKRSVRTKNALGKQVENPQVFLAFSMPRFPKARLRRHGTSPMQYSFALKGASPAKTRAILSTKAAKKT